MGKGIDKIAPLRAKVEQLEREILKRDRDGMSLIKKEISLESRLNGLLGKMVSLEKEEISDAESVAKSREARLLARLSKLKEKQAEYEKKREMLKRMKAKSSLIKKELKTITGALQKETEELYAINKAKKDAAKREKAEKAAAQKKARPAKAKKPKAVAKKKAGVPKPAKKPGAKKAKATAPKPSVEKPKKEPKPRLGKQAAFSKPKPEKPLVPKPVEEPERPRVPKPKEEPEFLGAFPKAEERAAGAFPKAEERVTGAFPKARPEKEEEEPSFGLGGYNKPLEEEKAKEEEEIKPLEEEEPEPFGPEEEEPKPPEPEESEETKEGGEEVFGMADLGVSPKKKSGPVAKKPKAQGSKDLASFAAETEKILAERPEAGEEARRQRPSGKRLESFSNEDLSFSHPDWPDSLGKQDNALVSKENGYFSFELSKEPGSGMDIKDFVAEKISGIKEAPGSRIVERKETVGHVFLVYSQQKNGREMLSKAMFIMHGPNVFALVFSGPKEEFGKIDNDFWDSVKSIKFSA